MEKNIKGARQTFLEGLSIFVSDIENAWSTLRIAESIPLGRLDWQWNCNGHPIREYSNAARAVFQVNTSSCTQSKSTTSTTTIDLPRLYKDCDGWYLNPYVAIFAVSVNQLDKSSGRDVWNRLRAFTESCRDQHQEHIIVCTASDEDVTTQKRIFEKLRSEVNTISKTIDRVVTISVPKEENDSRPSIITHLHHSPIHSDFLIRIRDFLKDSIQKRLQLYDDELCRFYDSQKSNKSWSLPRFLLMKEGLAFVFTHLGKRDLAVKQYEYVYAMISDHHDVEYKSFCDLPAADVAQGLSNPEFRDYRNMLRVESISEIDFHTYIISRQFVLLLVDRKYTLIAEKGIKFISLFMRRCGEEIISANSNSPTSIPITVIFRDVWTFTCARILSTMLTPAVPSPNDSAQNLSSQLASPRDRFAVRLVASFHVQALKALENVEQIVLPGCLSSEEPKVEKEDRAALVKEALATSNEKLKKALVSRKAAETLYSEIANAAASLYEMGHRARGAAALDGDAGRVHLINNSFVESEALLSAQCSRFMNDQGWDMLHRRQRTYLAEAEKELKRTHEYLVSCLTMLYMGRTSRFLTPLSDLDDDEVRDLKKEATFWVAETIKAAEHLPHMMRYKAERLFDVSVLPNDDFWEDGSPGLAVVRIKSDILVDFSLDSVTLECKCLDVPSTRKSALNRRNEPDSSKGNIEVTTKNGVGANSTESTSSDLFSLKSEGTICVKPGVNNFTVVSTEVPHFGRYRVNLVAMFLEKLKFVYTATKIGINPIAVTQKRNGAKSTSSTIPTSPLVDFAVFQAPAPFFYAARRPPSAKVEFETPKPLYLVKGGQQLVTVKISAGEKGLAVGAKLKCSLLVPEKVGGSSKRIHRFVEFLQSSERLGNSNIEGDSNTVTLGIRRLDKDVNNDEKNALDIGEAVIERDLKSEQVLCAKIGLNVLSDVDRRSGGNNNQSFNREKCIFVSELTWCERESSTERKFSRREQTQLVFESPIQVMADLELNSKCSSDNVSSGVGLDGTPLGDGGTLICSICSRTTVRETIDIRSISLDTPPWLELRPDEEPPHTSLLPCSLQSESEFICAFDVSVREEERNRQEFSEQLANDGSFQEDAMKQLLPRRIERHADMVNVDDHEDEGRGLGEEELSQVELSGQLLATLREKSGGASGESLIDERKREDEHSLAIEVGGKEVDEASVRFANEVVDLSSTDIVFPPNDDSKSHIGDRESLDMDKEGKEGECVSVAKLKIELKIDNVVGWTTMERKISMMVLKDGAKRYGIERRIKFVGEVGKVMEMKFRVWCIGGGEEEEDSQKVEYEVKVDRTAWVVVGRQRGVMELRGGNKEGGGRTGSAKLLPIDGGRRNTPRIELYECDGRGIGASRCDTVDENMQVVIMPCRTVVSACRGGDAIRVDGRDEDDDGNMPIIISSNRFFES